MDGRTRYKKISNMLKPIVGKTFHLDQLRRRVMVDIGSTKETVNETIRVMIDLGLIKEVKEWHYKVINFEADLG